jgi:5-methylcytosine-specific restriction enzyme subunit McrC
LEKLSNFAGKISKQKFVTIKISPMANISLIEYQPRYLEKSEIDEKIEEIICQNYDKYLKLEAPSFKNQRRWKLTPQGYIGVIPITADLTIRIQPKTPIANIWKMIDTIGNLPSLKLFDRLTVSDRIEDLCDHLAQLLATQTLDRVRHGLTRRYQPHHDRLIAPRGRIDWPRTARTPWQTRLPCRYDTHTADIPDNQILLWTLHQLQRTRHLFRDTTQTKIRNAYRALNGSISLVKFTATDCQNRNYDRLNADYKTPHALCRFFLQHLSPGQHYGDHQTLPFVLNTASLYEKFVAAWLYQNLPDRYRLEDQEDYKFSQQHKYCIDLVIYDRATNQPIAVLDTKYKIPTQPSNDDIYQILAYALFKQTDRAILIYPELLPYPLDETTQTIHIQTLTFSLDRNLDTAGNDFLDQLQLA